MNRCDRCLMPDTRPRVVFTDGVCNACYYHEEKKIIDWNEREAEFHDLVKEHKRHPAYDCIVPFSGGKDSATIALRLRGMGYNPLLVCYGQMLWTESGRHNFDAVCRYGLDILYWRVNQDISRVLARRFLIERGHPKVHYDAGLNACPIITAKNMGIPLVVYAEHGETEYGGLVLSETHRRERNLEEVLEHCVGDDARNWATDGITERDLYPYIYPDDVEGVKAVYFSYFFPWDIYENALLVRDELGFQPAHILRTPKHAHWAWGRSDGSFEGFDSLDDMIDDLDFYMMYRKFGFGRATRMASRLIQYGHMSRAEGKLWIDAFDGEFPKTYLPWVLDYLRISDNDLADIIKDHTESL